MMTSPETLSEPSQSLQELVTEGRRLLQSGDPVSAHAYFVIATQIAPEDETLWLLRADATPDPSEAAEALEHVVALDPENGEARSRLMAVRMNALQEEAKITTTATTAPQLNGGLSFLRGCLLWGSIAVIALSMLAGIALLLVVMTARDNAGAVAVKSDSESTTSAPLVLPPTWTPAPTAMPTSTPLPTATPVSKTTRKATVRSGPGTNYATLGTLAEGSVLHAVARSEDAKYVQIEFPDASRLGWVTTDSVSLAAADVAALAAVVVPTPVVPVRAPVTVATPKPVAPPTATPIPTLSTGGRVEFALGRPVDNTADCSKPAKIMGTVYDSPAGAQRVNGVLVRVWAFGQIQSTVTTGSYAYIMPGYWEWSFNPNTDVTGQVAIVNSDGSLRSQPVGFNLTARCDGAGAVNKVVIDFTGVQY